MRLAVLVLAVSSLGFLTACERTTPLSASSRHVEGTTGAPPSFAQFQDVPVPPGAKMDLDRSLVLGDREAWIGRLMMAVGMTQSLAYDFYFSEMPRFGWSTVTTVRGETAVLTYTRGSRVATIQIWPRTITGAMISMTISPAGKTAPPPLTTYVPPNEGVTTNPIR